jgi:DNA-binding beta-propeller fold protein YncE
MNGTLRVVAIKQTSLALSYRTRVRILFYIVWFILLLGLPGLSVSCTDPDPFVPVTESPQFKGSPHQTLCKPYETHVLSWNTVANSHTYAIEINGTVVLRVPHESSKLMTQEVVLPPLENSETYTCVIYAESGFNRVAGSSVVLHYPPVIKGLRLQNFCKHGFRAQWGIQTTHPFLYQHFEYEVYVGSENPPTNRVAVVSQLEYRSPDELYTGQYIQIRPVLNDTCVGELGEIVEIAPQEFPVHYELTDSFNQAESGPGGEPFPFSLPLGVHTQENRIYVVDSGMNGFLVLDTDKHLLWERLGISGFTGGTVCIPQCVNLGPLGIDVDMDGNSYVVDVGDRMIRKYNSTGQLIMSWGGKGEQPGQFLYPARLVVHSALNRVYVTDSDRSRIQYFSLDGNYLGYWDNQRDSEAPYGGFDLALAPESQTLFCTDTTYHRVHAYDLDGNPKYLIANSPKDEFPLEHPGSLAVDPCERVIFIGDPVDQSIQIRQLDGTFLYIFPVLPTVEDQESFVLGMDLSLDQDLCLYIADAYGLTIKKYCPIWE